jgi:hypothetical protein
VDSNFTNGTDRLRLGSLSFDVIQVLVPGRQVAKVVPAAFVGGQIFYNRVYA